MMLEASLLLGSRIRHGFFTREGGVSEGPFASLNVGTRGGDEPLRVARNRQLAAARLQAAAERLVTPRQVHGCGCIAVDAPWSAEDAPEADALITATPGLALGVLSADCVPVLLLDEAAGVIAAAHAGWRGALAGVIEAVLAGMRDLGGEPARTRVGIGPAIGLASYAIGAEFEQQFRSSDPAAAEFFATVREGSRHFDLPGYCRSRLERAGVAAIDMLAFDTCADPRFFSHRRSASVADRRHGLQLSAILLTG